MKLVFDDEQTKEIDGALLTELLKEAYALGVANACVKYVSEKRLRYSINTILRVTWGNEEWLRNFIDKMFGIARKSLEEKKEKPE